MQFFEGRIYKPQGKDLTNIVSSRVPVVVGSLSVQDGTLYYCKSCSYQTDTNNYNLEWTAVTAGSSTTVYNYVEIGTGATDNLEIVGSELVKDAETTEGNATIYKQCIKIKDNKFVPLYATEGSILQNIIGSDTSMIDALCYASQSELHIDSFNVIDHFYPSIRYKVTDQSKDNMPMTEYHTVLPLSDSTEKTMYLPSFGASQCIDFFGVSGSNITASINALSSGDSYLNLEGSHVVLTYREYLYAAVIDQIDESGNVIFTDVVSNDLNYVQVDSAKISLTGATSPYTDTEYDIDTNTSDYKSQMSTFELTLTLSLKDGAKDVSDYTKEKFALYVTLDSSLIVK